MTGLVPLRTDGPRLGQVSTLVGGITSNLAKQIVQEAEPAVRSIIRDERNRFVEALSGGLPFGAAAAAGYVGTSYLVPDGAKVAKVVGYSASAAALGIGAWLTFRRLTEKPAEPEAAAPATPPPEVVQQAAKALIQEAEPRVRQIVDEERARAAAALQAGLPFAGAAAAAFLATMFLVGAGEKTLKAVGYSSTALLLGAGAWVALSKEKEAAA